MADKTTRETFLFEVKRGTNDTNRIEGDITDLRNAMKALGGDTEGAGMSAEEAEGKFTDFANNALGTFAGQLGGQLFTSLGGAALDQVGNVLAWDDALRTLNATTDLTDTEFQSLKDSAFNVYTDNWVASVEDATQKLGQAQRITGLLGEELETLTNAGAMWESEFGAGFDESIRASNQLMLQFGTDATTTADLITYAFQKTGDPNGELLDTFNEYSSTFAELGFSAEGFTGLLISASEEGIYSMDKIADVARETGIRFREGVNNPAISDAYDNLIKGADDFGIHFEDGSTKAISSYDDLVGAMNAGWVDQEWIIQNVASELLKIEDPLERNALAAELLGTQYEDLGDDVLRAFEGMENVDATGAMDTMQTEITSASDALEALRRVVEVELFQLFEPLIVDLTQKAIPAIEGLISTFKTKVVPEMKRVGGIIKENVTDKFDDAVEAIEPIIEQFEDFIDENEDLIGYVEQFGLAFGVAVGVILAVTLAFTGLTAVVGVLGAGIGLLLSPIVLVAAAFAALYLAYTTNFLGFGDAVDEVFGKAKDVFNDFLDFMSGLIDAFKSGGIEGVWEYIKTNLIDPIVNGVTNYLANDAEADFKNFISDVWGIIVAGTEKLEDVGLFIFDEIIAPLALKVFDYFQSGDALADYGEFMLSVWDIIKLGVSALGEVGQFIFDEIIAPLALKVYTYITGGDAEDDYKSFISGIWEAIKGGASLISGVDTWVTTNLIVPIKDAILGGATALWDAFTGLINGAVPDDISITLPSVNLAEIMGAPSYAVSAFPTIGGQTISLSIGDPFATPFMKGGFTGLGNIYDVAGQVHFGETVVPHTGMTVHPDPQLGLVYRNGFGGNSGGGASETVVHTYVMLNEEQLAYAYNRHVRDNPSNQFISRSNRTGGFANDN